LAVGIKLEPPLQQFGLPVQLRVADEVATAFDSNRSEAAAWRRTRPGRTLAQWHFAGPQIG